ncbi:MAG: EamA family transporter [Thermoproteota archaeon]
MNPNGVGAWLILAFLSAFFAALVTIFGKIGLKTVDSTVAAGVRAVIMAATMIGIMILLGRTSQVAELTQRDMFFIILSGVSGALSWVFYFAALKLADASKVATIDRTSILFIIVLSYLVLGEEISLKTAAAGILVFLGALILMI